MKVRLRSIIYVLVISMLVLSCTPQQQEAATPTPIPTSVVPEKPIYTVQRGTVQKEVQFSARVSPLDEEDLYFKSGGYVSIVYVEKGDWVEAGTVLAELEVEDLRNQLALVEIDLQNAQNNYDAAVNALERQTFNAEMSLEAAKLRLEKHKAAPPTNNLSSQKLAIQRASESLEENKVAYAEALDRPWEPQWIRDNLLKSITNAERYYTELQTNYQYTLLQIGQQQVTYDINTQLLELDVTRAEQEITWLEAGVDPSLLQQLESAQIRVDRIQRQVENAQLIAPFDGEITAIGTIPGKAVEARKQVAVMADPSFFDITADLPSTQMDFLEEGIDAQVSLSRYPGEFFDAILLTLPYPYGTGGGAVQIEDRDPRTHLVLKNPDDVPDLKVGDLVKVSVMVEQSVDTLWLPPAAIRTFENRKFVMVRGDDGRLRKVDIKIGIEAEDAIEVLDGLEEGQVIEGL